MCGHTPDVRRETEAYSVIHRRKQRLLIRAPGGHPMPCWTAATRAPGGQGLLLNRTIEGHTPPPRRQAAGLCLKAFDQPCVRGMLPEEKRGNSFVSSRSRGPEPFYGRCVQKSPVRLVLSLARNHRPPVALLPTPVVPMLGGCIFRSYATASTLLFINVPRSQVLFCSYYPSAGAKSYG